MADMGITAGLGEEGRAAVIHLFNGDDALGHIILEAPELDQFIQTLAAIRAGLTEQVTPELDPGARLSATIAPGWRIPDTHSGPEDAILLALRHPGLGWLSFLLEPERARQIGQALADRS